MVWNAALYMISLKTAFLKALLTVRDLGAAVQGGNFRFLKLVLWTAVGGAGEGMYAKAVTVSNVLMDKMDERKQ